MNITKTEKDVGGDHMNITKTEKDVGGNHMNIDEMLDRHDNGDAREGIISEAGEFEIKKIKKAFKWKMVVTSLVVTTIVILLSVGAILGGVLGSAASYAKKAIVFDRNYAITQAEITAKEELLREYPDLADDIATLVFKEVHNDLSVRTPLTNSKYYYKVEFESHGGIEIEIHVDSKNGTLSVHDIDFD